MLKKFQYKGQDVPVPVPIHALNEAIEWIEGTLVKKDEVITKIALNGRLLAPEARHEWPDVRLNSNTNLEVQVDSPKDLAIKSLDVVRDLANELEKRIKVVAVRCWQKPQPSDIVDLNSSIADCDILIDLINHVNGIVDYAQEDMAAINGLAIMLKRIAEKLEAALSTEDWYRCARLLVGRLDPLLRDLVTETEMLEIRLFTAAVDDTHQVGMHF